MAQTTASVATYGNDPQDLPHLDAQIQYVSLLGALTFGKTTINQREIEFWVGHGPCDDGESTIFDPKKTLHCRYRIEIISSDKELVDCCLGLTPESLQSPKKLPSWPPKNLPTNLSSRYHGNKQTHDNKQTHNDRTECKGCDRTVDCCIGVQQRSKTATT